VVSQSVLLPCLSLLQAQAFIVFRSNLVIRPHFCWWLTMSGWHSTNSQEGFAMWKEFKEFVSKGNVLDLAVGVIIGAAFGKIVSSLVDDVLMPIIGMAFGGASLKDKAITLGTMVNDKGETVANLLKYGNFIQAIIDFIILAFVIFLIVRAANKIRAAEPPPAPTATESLLGEIRDLLKR
jgi:large conductance mechanosensitive channel